MSRVDIGLLEKCEPWRLHSCFFPSKVGGRPAWLDFTGLPSDELQCARCRRPMSFLCQVYAPHEDKDECFHRTLFMFLCRRNECCVLNDAASVAVFRSQLPRSNGFYAYEPAPETEASCFDVATRAKLCTVCGCSATKHCAKCRQAAYCSRDHQLADWRAGHRTSCGSDNAVRTVPDIVFNEWELVTEPEDDSHDEGEAELSEQDELDDSDEAEQRRVREFEQLVREGGAGSLADADSADLEPFAETCNDKAFERFSDRVSRHNSQVLRYERGGQPLWIAAGPRPAAVPDCELCGAPRHFEFQVLPQLLFELRDERLDWGVLAVYCCRDSCAAGPPYRREFVFKQDIVGEACVDRP